MNTLNLLKEIGKIISIPSNEHVFYEGDSSNSLYIILKGSIKIYRQNLINNSNIDIATLNSGEIFGEMAMICHDKRSACAITLEDSLFLEIPSYNFEKFISIEPKYTINLLKTLVQRKNDIKSKVSLQEDL